MLTYAIKKEKPRQKSKSNFTKGEILERNLAATIFKVGDRVRFKKPRRNPVYATVVGIQSDALEITWTADDVPMNILLEVEKRTPINNGMMVTKERVKTNVKKLIWAGMGVPK